MKWITVPFFISHQGCPHTCVFCDQHTISGAAGILPGSSELVEKVRLWRCSAEGRPLEAAFFGGTFSALPIEVQERLLDPLQPLLASGELTSVRISTRPDCISEDNIRWLAERGVRTIELGVQSMDDGVLADAGRGHDAASSEAAIRCIKGNGLTVGAQLMPGLPCDTTAKSLESLERVIAAGADFVRIYPAVVLRGTELARKYLAGEYQPLDVARGLSFCKPLLHAAMRVGVDVVRMGLQADEGLSSNTVLAGCWHPAFGQLVRSELYFDLLGQLSAGLPADAPLTIRCHPLRLSDVIGHKKTNLIRLRSDRKAVNVTTDNSLLPEEVAVDCLTHSIRGDLVKDLHFNVREV